MNHEAATNSGSRIAPRRQTLLAAAAIVAVTLLAYIPAMRGGFLWDDDDFLVNNRLIKASDGLPRLWLTTQPRDYLPLTGSMLWIEWRLWGEHPAGYHVVNVLLHAAGAILLWRVLACLKLPGAWLAGLLFAVHPVAVASVAWISERKNTLSMMFYLLSLLVYLEFDDDPGDGEIRRLGDSEIGRLGNSRTLQSPNLLISQSPILPICQSPNLSRSAGSPRLRVYVASLLLFLLALLSKTSVVMLPAILLLCAWWRRGRISRKDLLRSLPFFALSLALGLVTVWFQRQHAIHDWTVRPEGIASRIAAAGWVPWFCLCKILLPVGLCAIYPRWKVDGSSLLAFLPLLILLGGMAFLWTRRKSGGRAPLFALAYLLITLLPVLGFLDMSFMRYSFVADHLQYAAMIAAIALAAGLLAHAAAAIGLKRRGAIVAAAGCAGVLGILTWNRAAVYAGEMPLWRDNVAKNPAAWSAWGSLGNACSAAGLHDEAIRCFDKAVSLGPDVPESYANRAGAYARAGKFAEAIKGYDKAISMKEDFPTAYYDRGCVYAVARDFTRAIRDYDRAITLDEKYAAAYNNRGVARAGLGQSDEAIGDYTKAIESEPDYAEAYYNRARVFFHAGRFADAVHDYTQAIALSPRLAAAYNNRALAYHKLGEDARALKDLKTCRKLGGNPDPGFVRSLMEAVGGRDKEE